jgi:cation:H+ antiporter
VVLAGIALARFGDELAEHTGWGHLWVGTILVSVATSLPELFISVTAVAIDAAPLALGNVFGADMINMWTVAMVAVVFGSARIFRGHDAATRRLAMVAVVLALLAVAFGVSGDMALGRFSVGALVVALAYVGGMRLVYTASKRESCESEARTLSARRAWLGFGAAVLVIGAASPILAISADGIAEATGVSKSFLGVLAVSVVTTLPEASVSVAAAHRGAYGLVLGNIYGSCAFNIVIIAFIDPVHGAQPVLAAMGPEHFVAGGMAVLLMASGLLVLQAYRTRSLRWLRVLLPVMLVAYPAGLYWVFAVARA